MMKTIFTRTLCMTVLCAAMLSCSQQTDGGKETAATETATPAEARYNNPRKELGRPKSVLILSSSPRRGGNSEALCSQFMNGAQEAGHKLEMININDYDISYFDQREYDRSVPPAETGGALHRLRTLQGALSADHRHPCTDAAHQPLHRAAERESACVRTFSLSRPLSNEIRI